MIAKNWWISILLLSVLALSSSCGSTKTLTELEKFPCKEITDRIALDTTFPERFAARYACEVSIGAIQNQKFSATVKSVKDSITTISIAPLLGIELFRLYLFPDSIIFMNKLDKKYYIGGYDYLSEQLETSLNLQLIQDLLRARPIKYMDSDRYKCDRNSTQYIVKNVPSRKLRKALGILKGENFEEDPDSVYLYNDANRKLKKAIRKDDDIFIKRYFMDAGFNLARVIIHEVENNNLLEINYGTLQNFSGTYIPRLIEVNLSSPDQVGEISINPAKFKIIDQVESDYNIPDKYERIEFR